MTVANNGESEKRSLVNAEDMERENEVLPPVAEDGECSGGLQADGQRQHGQLGSQLDDLPTSTIACNVDERVFVDALYRITYNTDGSKHPQDEICLTRF